MAVTFNSIGGGSITIGGSGADPFPKYSISTEGVQSGDGTLIDITYNVSITGQVLASGDITAAGSRQSSLLGRIKTMLQTAENAIPVGTLEIVPYGGLSGVVSFSDATLMAVEIAEQDDSGSVQYQDYTFTFTAHKRDGAKIGNTYSLASAEETWEVTENDTRVFESNTLSNTPTKTYTITHTVSATGYNKTTDTAFNKAGWSEAKDWVLSRLVATPDTAVDKNMADNSTYFTTFNGVYMGASSADFIDLSTDEYYNHNRVANSDLSGGAYSVTETWFISKESVTHDIEMSYDLNEEQIGSVTVNGTISGLSTSSFSSKKDNKVTQAEAVLTTVLDQGYSLASTFFNTVKEPDAGALTNNILTKSVAKNPVAGTITYSINFNDKTKEDEDTISETLTVSDDNEDRSNKVIAIIAIIGKADGPIFQDMGTTPERKRSVSVDWTMKKDKRETKPTARATTAADVYKPTGAYQMSKSESWTPATGAYTLNIEWVY